MFPRQTIFQHLLCLSSQELSPLESQTTYVHKIKAYHYMGSGLIYIKSKRTVLKTQIIINNSSNDSNSHHLPKLPSK